MHKCAMTTHHETLEDLKKACGETLTCDDTRSDLDRWLCPKHGIVLYTAKEGVKDNV